MEIPEGEGWIPNVGVKPAYRGTMDLLLRNGRHYQENGLWTYRWRWELIGTNWDIIKWRPKDAE